MEAKLANLKNRMQEYMDLRWAAALLSWDQATYMPPEGAAGRGRQMALLTRMSFEKLGDPEVGKLLDELEPWAETLPFDHDDAAFVRETRRTYDRQVRIPPALIAEFYTHSAQSYHAWVKARPANDFEAVRPYLEKTLEYSRRLADFFPGYDHIADPLIDMADYGMKAADVRRVFGELRRQLVPLVQAITAQEPADDRVLRQFFPQDQQLAISKFFVGEIGYDMQRGRLDLTHHPFMTKFGLGDVRITTRVDENDLGNCLFSSLHEAGHAMYELGIRRDLDGSPLAVGTSAGVHESQSRTWENIVGRSRDFWEHYYPKLQETFPEQLKPYDLDTFYRAINKVQPSLIRTEADEVTYNLHVMIRFELELALLEGSLEIKDLPQAWNERYAADLGITPQDDRDGVMQDVHWYYGLIGGAFQGYTLGNLLSAMFYDKALSAHPQIPAEIRQGKFDTLRGWMTDNIYQHGSKFTAPELIDRVTGGGLQVEPLINYLKSKYGEIYSL